MAGRPVCGRHAPFPTAFGTKFFFTAVADALEWMAHQRGVPEIDHYLDDFVTLGPHATADCQKNLDIIIQTCTDLGIPLALEKLEGPTTCLTFLGIEINTLNEPFAFLKTSLTVFCRPYTCAQDTSHARDSS